MTEVLKESQSGELQQPTSTPEAYRERLRRGFREAGGAVLSLLDVNAGIALARNDIAHKQTTMDSLNNRYDGILERQSQTDIVSMALQDDIVLDFRRDAQRAGFTDNLDEMDADARYGLVEGVLATHLDTIAAELRGHHPEWTDEQVDTVAAQRARDIATLLTMNTQQRDTYNAAMFDYRGLKGEVTTLNQEVADLYEQRHERVGRMGNVAVKALLGFGSRLRDMPYAAGARLNSASLRAVEGVREWFGSKNAGEKRTILVSTASIAVVGIAAIIAMRLRGGHSGGMMFVGNESPLDGSGQPVDATYVGGGPIETSHVGNTGRPVDVASVGTEGAPVDAVRVGAEGGPVNATHIGVEAGGPVDATHVGVETGGPVDAVSIGEGPVDVSEIGGGPVTAEHIGGTDLSSAKTTSELFGDSLVAKWPDTVKVGEWDSQTKDGSLWGISTAMLQRSGIKNPSNEHIEQLVDALRPQARPNGYLDEGQVLDLRPAIDLLTLDP